MSKSVKKSTIKTKYMLIVTIDVTYLQLAYIRSVLAQSETIYVEVSDTFLISCDNKYRDILDQELKKVGINYILVFVNIKTGSKALVNGLSDNDFSKIKNIVEEN